MKRVTRSWFFRIGLPVAFIAAGVLIYTLVFPFVTVRASTGIVSIAISLNDNQIVDTSDPTLEIMFEPSGTHVDTKGNLKIRLDFYPTTESKSYSTFHIQVPDETSKEYQAGYLGKVDKEGNPVDQEDYNKWYESLPKVWAVTPCLCHFITVKPDLSLAELDAYVKALFPGTVTNTIDDAMIQENSAHLISPYMRDKSSTTAVKMWEDTAKMTPVLSEMVTKGILTTAEASSLTTTKSNPEIKAKVDTYVVERVNTTLADFSLGTSPGGTKEDIKPGSIDVGPGASDRGSRYGYGYTILTLENPANAVGTLDSFELFAETNMTDTIMGTLYGSGTDWTPRDYESIGAVASGSKQTFTGLSCDVQTSDIIGTYFSSGYLERENTGGSNGAKSGNQFSAGLQTYTISVRILSLYATGTEAGGTYDITNDPSTKNFGFVLPSTSYYAKGSAPSNPVSDNECSYTLTSTGSAATDIDVHGHNATGGDGWTLVSGAPGAQQYALTAYYSGQNPASGVALTTSDQEFYDNLASSGHIHWDFKLDTGTFTDGAQKTAVITLTGRAHS